MPDRRQGLLYCLKVFLAVRVGLFLMGFLAVGLLPQNDRVGVPGRDAPAVEGGWSNAWTAWERSDALWYLRIAADGYRLDDSSAAFFPLYPLLVKVVATLTGGAYLLAGYLVANLAVYAAMVVLYRLTALELDESAARRTVLYLCVFPTGFFLFAPYTESLFLALSVGALYAARRSRWGAAAALGALAALTRSPGVLLALPLLVEGALQARALQGTSRQRWAVLASGAGASAATAGGLLLHLGYWERVSGDWRRPVDAQRTGFGKESSWPWETVADGLRVAGEFPGAYPGGYFAVDALILLLVVACLVWVSLRVRLTYAVYGWAAVVFPLFLQFAGRPLLSLPRIYLVIFPVLWALSRFAERWRAHDLVVGASAALMGLLAALFVSSYPIF